MTACNVIVSTFRENLQKSLLKYDKGQILKDKQIESLLKIYNGNYVIINLNCHKKVVRCVWQRRSGRSERLGTRLCVESEKIQVCNL